MYKCNQFVLPHDECTTNNLAFNLSCIIVNRSTNDKIANTSI